MGYIGLNRLTYSSDGIAICQFFHFILSGHRRQTGVVGPHEDSRKRNQLGPTLIVFLPRGTYCTAITREEKGRSGSGPTGNTFDFSKRACNNGLIYYLPVSIDPRPILLLTLPSTRSQKSTSPNLNSISLISHQWLLGHLTPLLPST